MAGADKSAKKSADESVTSGQAGRWITLASVAAVALVLLGAYSPALHGAFLWDDVAHLPEPHLRDLAGLWRIVTEPGVSQQYYPVLAAAFWVQQRIWGEWTTGYHVVNLCMHGVASLLLWAVLRRLTIPGAGLAAALFALHPVHVESVAWIAELKNTLSGSFYLAALLAYLRFEGDPAPRRSLAWWGAAFVLFALAILSKSVTASLPAAILVIFWWQRGDLSWRRDVVPLLPFFVLAAGFGWYSARFEAEVVGASGERFQLDFASRCLIAGRAFWFYLGKLVWPWPLTFIYPRWQLDPTSWVQWLFPVTAAGLVTSLWFLRERLGRGPLAAVLFFAGTLFPASGFVNVYPFRFSFVADHFQYLASLGGIVLGAAVLTRIGERFGRQGSTVVGVVVVGVFAMLTWRQSHHYRSPETLWSATVADNPDSFLAQIGLGVIYADQGKHRAAIVAQERAIQIDPGSGEARLNLARSYDALGDDAAAARWYEEGVEFEPGYLGEVRPRLARLYVRLQQYDRAVAMARLALAQNPGSAYLHTVLGLAHEGLGRRAEAEREFRAAIALEPNSEGARIAREKLAELAP